MTLTQYCPHMHMGWCRPCVRELLNAKDEELDEKDSKILELASTCGGLKEMCKTFKELTGVKHGYGVPPREDGYYFYRYATLTDRSNPQWYFYLYKEKRTRWSGVITEYFGPIPFEVWDAVKKEEKSDLQKTLSNVMAEWTHNNEIAQPCLLDILETLVKSVEELQEKTNA